MQGSWTVDRKRAATTAGNDILSINPNLLIIVEGVGYALDLTAVYSNPIQLSVPNRLVYEAHDYSWDHSGASCSTIQTDLGNKWGYILTQGQSYTAPIWVGEFGTCHKDGTCVYDSSGQGLWYACFRNYLYQADIDWSYWALNGTQSTGNGRIFGAEETYGVLNTTWSGPALRQLTGSLQGLMPASQGP